MAQATDSGPVFFTKATPEQWNYVLSQYKEVLKEKASKRTKKGGPEELIRLDTWYQEQLPKIIQSRKPPHIVHEELIQIVKWKLMRGKFRPRLTDLVRINTETAVLQTSKKAFRKKPSELSQAITALTNLKGVGPATASAILAAAFPDNVPYMADESMLSTPGIEATDYTLAEYLNYAEHIKKCTERLQSLDPKSHWTPHKVELTLWTHYLARDLKPSILEGMPHAKSETSENGDHADDNAIENGSEPSSEGVISNPPVSTDDEKELPSEENTNDSHADSGKENVGESADGADDEEPGDSEKTSPDEPPAKKLCVEQ
ncbi:uncharacterized protein [Parasteatoda tepidariorum]|uniref:uncharacterized protein n=1 Tax=Parasteatoda tepidariorum TaxID=114398 RepID=UPI00077FA862|nr:uncharacterized protein LOC107448618 [Parasteatoda tepidariorum]